MEPGFRAEISAKGESLRFFLLRGKSIDCRVPKGAGVKEVPVAHMCDPSTQEVESQELLQVWASLSYIVSARPAQATE